MTKVYFNHDGGVDDVVSLFLLLQMDNLELIGVSTIGADCYLEPSVSASIKIINRFSKQCLQVAPSYERGKNPFPKEWRMHAFFMDALPMLNESHIHKRSKMSDYEVYEDLIQKVKASNEKVTLLFTGPLTDLAKAISCDKSFLKNVNKLVWMGGTFLEKGNVEEPEHDGTAEWNAFWDPKAVKTVFDSDIKIDMVALESTNQVPLTDDVRKHWADKRSYVGVDFLGVSYAAVPPLTHFVTNSTYFLWDVLTTAYVGKPKLVKSVKMNVDVVSHGPSQGKTFRDDNGRKVNVINYVERNVFFDYIMRLAQNVKV